MSESEIFDVKQSQPETIYLANYQLPNYFIDEVKLDFDLYDDKTIVSSELFVRINRHKKGVKNELILNGEELKLVSIAIDGKALATSDYNYENDLLTLTGLPDTCMLSIKVEIHPEKNTALSGLYRSRQTFCTQCEAEGFRRITFYQDRPDVLAKFTTTIHADKATFPSLLSNGNLIQSGDEDGGRHFATWEDPFKKPAYLFALVAGDFDLVEDTYLTQSNRSVDLKVYVEKGYGDQAHHAVYSLKEAMRWDETTYGREYDLDIYMIVAISDFNMGAMENKGLNIFNTKYVLAKPETATDQDYIYILSVVGHEYFHNWSGNRVTCRDWFQLSLKEGLTIFRDQSFTEDLLSKGVMRIHDVNALREQQYPEDAGPLAHPVRPESYIEINNFYTATVYNKGAEVLRMLQTIIGRKKFRQAMDLYFATYDGQAVTIEDYVKNMEDVSGLDLQQFRLWYSQAGTPSVKVVTQYDEKSQTYTLEISQHLAKTPGQDTKLPMHIPIRIGLLDASGNNMPLHQEGQTVETEKVLHLTEASQKFVFTNVKNKPVPSLFRGFSAPVKLSYDYTDNELLFLLEHDKDDFNRWEAGQTYALRNILRLIDASMNGDALSLNQDWFNALKHILTVTDTDLYLVSELLRVPSENYIGEQMDVVDVDAIHQVREFVLDELANHLSVELKAIYNKFHKPTIDKQFNIKEVGQRALKNVALSYLARIQGGAELAMRQFEQFLTQNMTETAAALQCLVNCKSSMTDKALAQFYDTWQQDALVVDKWLAIQATSRKDDTLQKVMALTKHEAFDLKNPNKVYSLIGAFGMRNPSAFHVSSGEGYQFLRDIIQQLDKLNPQVAARMVKPLTAWRRYDTHRQQLMREALQQILKEPKLSPDMFELVSKSLKS